jgi:hypothetical protein
MADVQKITPCLPFDDKLDLATLQKAHDGARR